MGGFIERYFRVEANKFHVFIVKRRGQNVMTKRRRERKKGASYELNQ
jgi:transposase